MRRSRSRINQETVDEEDREDGQAWGDIFAITCIKTMAVFVVIAFYYLTGLY